MNASLTADQVLPVTGASVTALAHGRGIVLHDPDGELLDVMFAMPEYGPCIAGAWRREPERQAIERRDTERQATGRRDAERRKPGRQAGARGAAGGWALAAGQAAADDPIDVTFLRPRRATKFLTAAPARVHRLGDLWVAEAAGDFTAAMVRTPAGVRARRLEA